MLTRRPHTNLRAMVFTLLRRAVGAMNALRGLAPLFGETPLGIHSESIRIEIGSMVPTNWES